MTRPGYFLTLEGGDGAGKSTHARLLAKALRSRFAPVPVHAVRQPGGTRLGEALRNLVLHGEEMAATTEALIYAADRAEHVHEVIAPALRRGEIVVCDRYIDSSIAYQVDGRGLALGDVVAINEFATGGLWPNLTVVLDVEPAIGRARVGGEPDRLERAGDSFHDRVRERYLTQVREHPERYVCVTAAGPIRDVQQRLREVVFPLIDAWASR